jgi:chromosome segregation ATPase
MNKPVDSNSPSFRKSEGKIQALHDRIYQLEREILERDQASYERLDAIARSSEILQGHYQKAIDQQAVLASALEQSQAQIRILQQSLDLSENQLSDLRSAYAETVTHLDRLRVGLDGEMNEKMLLENECQELRQQLADVAVVRDVNSSLLVSLGDLDQVIDQSEVRCSNLALGPAADVHQLQDMLSESELRIAELSGSLDSERAYYGSIQENLQKEIDATRVSLSAAECAYGDLLAKYQAVECQTREQSQLVQSLSAANQLLADELRNFEDQLSSRDETVRTLQVELADSKSLLNEHAALAEDHQQLLLAKNDLDQQVQSLADRESELLQAISDLHAQVIGPQRDRLDQLEASNSELDTTVRQLTNAAEENQMLKKQIDRLKVDFSINEQALDQQLRLTEAQRQEAESRFHEALAALDQAKHQRDAQAVSLRQYREELKHQLLSIRSSLDLESADS